MKFEMFQARRTNGSRMEWYWRTISAKGKSTAIGGEGYYNFADMTRAMRTLFSTGKWNGVLERCIAEKIAERRADKYGTKPLLCFKTPINP